MRTYTFRDDSGVGCPDRDNYEMIISESVGVFFCLEEVTSLRRAEIFTALPVFPRRKKSDGTAQEVRVYVSTRNSP